MIDEVKEDVEEEADEAAEAAAGITPDLSILEGKKVNKKGKILDEEGEPIGQLTEDSDVKKCAGKTPLEANAGALITPDSLARAASRGLLPRSYLDRNDAFSWFEALGDLIVTGPTFTNVNDFRALLVL